jgi:hypothetical protein
VAAAGIGIAILIMIGVSLVRGGWMLPPLVMPAAGPPWEIPVRHVSADLVTYALWLAALLGTGGVVAGLLAIHRGARLSARILLVAGLITVAVLTVLPPTGSTDALDYATYGRLVALGHSPYVTTPAYLRHLHNAFAHSVPRVWDHYVSVYGPLATMEQFLAAKLGGASAARITFWLKLWDSAAFAVVAVVLDRLLRHNPARRLRAHLLWTVNPLLLWDLVAAGHLDVLAIMAGLLGLLVLGEQPAAGRPGLARVLAAGALLGIAADIKINYVLFGLGAAWALRRSLPALALAGAAALAVLVPSYAYFGTPAVRALLSRRNQSSADNFYRVPPARLATRLRDDRHHPGARSGDSGPAPVAAGRGHPSRHPAYRGPLHRLAVPLALPAALVRRDDHLRADPLPRLAAGLAGAGSPGRWNDLQHAGKPLPPAQPAALAHRPLRGPGADPDGHAGRGGRSRGVVPARELETQGCSRAGAHGPGERRAAGPGGRSRFLRLPLSGSAARRSYLAAAVRASHPAWAIWPQPSGRLFGSLASGGLTSRVAA